MTDAVEAARRIVALADRMGLRPKWDDVPTKWASFYAAKEELEDVVETALCDGHIAEICRALLAAEKRAERLSSINETLVRSHNTLLVNGADLQKRIDGLEAMLCDGQREIKRLREALTDLVKFCDSDDAFYAAPDHELAAMLISAARVALEQQEKEL